MKHDDSNKAIFVLKRKIQYKKYWYNSNIKFENIPTLTPQTARQYTNNLKH